MELLRINTNGRTWPSVTRMTSVNVQEEMNEVIDRMASS